MVDPNDAVEVLMTENMARAFEDKMLKPHNLNLVGPIMSWDPEQPPEPDAIPSYIIGLTNV